MDHFDGQGHACKLWRRPGSSGRSDIRDGETPVTGSAAGSVAAYLQLRVVRISITVYAVQSFRQVALEALWILGLASMAEMGVSVDAADSTEATSERLAVDAWRCGSLLRRYATFTIMTC